MEHKVDKEKVLKYRTIRPIVDGFYIKEPSSLFDVSYIWEPEKLDLARNLEKIGKITAYSRWGHPSLFKPSIGEIISAIPDDIIDQVESFQIISTPTVGGNYHVFEVGLYR